MSLRYGLARPFLFTLEAERAHHLAIRALKSGLVPTHRAPTDPRLKQRLLGLDFPNPIGMAAGFDKNGEIPDAVLALGFGFIEVGTVTPVPQSGNPRPRVFRLAADEAIINRLGFNNDGHDAVHRRLGRRFHAGIVGVNIGANRDSPDRIADYVSGVIRFADVADYLAINISSPNTPGLRDLQERSALIELLARVTTARATAARRVPILIKIAPDLDDAALAAIAETALVAGIEGIIVANTALARDGLTDRHATEAGGLSGRPLFRRSTILLAQLRKIVGRDLVLVGVGGVDSAEAALGKIMAGADLVQLYTGFIYKGPSLPSRIAMGMSRILARQGVASVENLVGRETTQWARMGAPPLP